MAVNKMKMAPGDVRGAVESMADGQVVSHSPDLVIRAIHTSQASKITMWDALIVEAARVGGCKILLTEDLSDGQVINGVRITNPFK